MRDKLLIMKEFHDISYRCEGFIFYRELNYPHVVVRQVAPNRIVKQLLSKFPDYKEK